ncbi:MAG: TcpQ domain-containing protein [Desulfovibrio sp.]|jgi:pyruvate/2-oxoglutarate dehydrogenase complex dihydrolipoamide acyltransferase (E2) component|nr:TcpQ domain-containing protein [Desulfovibrio sp.]
MNKAILIICVTVALFGCVYRSSSNGGTYDGVSVAYPTEAQKMAEKAANEMSRRYPPGHTTLSLNAAPGSFGMAFEDALRRQGFAVRSSGFADVGVTYTLDLIQQEPSCYLRIDTSDGRMFGFAYELSPEPGIPVTNPPSPLVAEKQLESRPLPVPEAVAPQAAAETLPPFTVRTSATAERIAERNHVSLADFCRWNYVEPDTVLKKGRRVYLSKPKKTAVTAAPPPAPVAPSPTLAERETPAPTKRVRYIIPEAQEQKPSVVPAAAPLPPVAAKPTEQPVAAAMPVSSVQAPPFTVEEISAPVEAKWSIAPGSLRSQLTAWCATAGYTMVWKAASDYEMESYAAFKGDFIEGIKQLFSGLQRSGFPLRTTIYKGNQVLEVTEN